MPQFVPICSKFYSTVHWLASLLTSFSIGLCVKAIGLCVKPSQPVPSPPAHGAIPEALRPWRGLQTGQQKIEQSASKCKHSRPPWVDCVLGATIVSHKPVWHIDDVEQEMRYQWDKRFSSVLWLALKETILHNITQYYRKVNLHIDITVQDEIQQFHRGDIEHRQDISIGWNTSYQVQRTNHY